MKFRKKPLVIEAMQFDGTYFNGDAIQSWACTNGNTHIMLGHFCVDRNSCAVLDVSTLEGTMTAKPGDWIIKGINGEFYPCKPDIFEKTYEPVTDA